MMRDPRFDKLQKLLDRNDFAAAEEVCRQAIRQNGSDVNMLAVLGVVQLRTGAVGDAEETLRKAIRLAPGFAKPHEDLGWVLLLRKSFEDAEACFRRAFQLLPQLESARIGLAQSLQHQGRLDEACAVCDQVLADNPKSLGALHLLATIRADQGDYTAAAGLLERAAAIAPGDANFRFMLAANLLTSGFAEKALAAFDAGLASRPDAERGRLGRLHALRNLGRIAEVIDGCRRCIDEGAGAAEAWWTLSSLRTYTFSDDDVERMQAARATPGIAEADAVYLDFALGKAMDDRERYDAAWSYYAIANAGRRKAVQWDSGEHERNVDTIIGCLDAATVARRAAARAGDAVPIFIVGMPRSGSTLVEQILASHSAVEATTEMPYLIRVGDSQVFAAAGGTPPVRNAGAGDLARVGASYLAATAVHRGGGAALFTDKEPENYLYAGLIAMILPEARIIDVRRDPLDTCVANFRQWFGQGKAFSYDLDELAHYYLQYRRLQRHWEEVLPGRILAVDYEALVEDTEAQVRRLLEHCGLPWEDACLRFHENRRAVTTASSEQVRQPIYRSAVGFWKNYDGHLGELKAALAPAPD